MTAINFPASPNPGDKWPTTGNIDGKVWAWDGTTWKIVSTNGTVTIIDNTARSFAFTVTYTNVPGSYNVVGTDRNGEVSGLNPTITVNEEDTLIFNVNASGHPFYLVWQHGGSSNQVGGGNGTNTASNQGTVNGTVTWVTDVGDGDALPTGELFYYQCGNHANMYGTIKVLLKDTSDSASHIHDLIDLDDTPSAYDDGKYLRSTATGTEWATVTSGTTYGVVDDQEDGLAPQLPVAHGGKFLKANGSWEVPDYSTIPGTFTTTAAGLAPLTPGGTTKFLRADGQWQVPAGSGTGSGYGIAQVIQETGPSSQISATAGQGSNASWIDVIDKDITLTDTNQVKIEVNGEPKLDGFRTMRYEVRLIRTTSATVTVLYEGYQGLADSSDNYSTMNGVLWLESPGVGTHNYKYQFRQVISWNNSVAKVEANSMVMLLTEIAPGSSGGTSDGNDYVTSAQLGVGANAKVLTLGFTDTTKNRTVDLSSLSTTDTNTTYDISLVDGTDATTKKIRLSSTNPTSIDEIIFKQGSYIQLIRSGEELEIKSVAVLSGLLDVDYAGQSPSANKILKYSTTVNSGAGGWTLGDDVSGSNNTDTTYSISCADGDNVDEEKIRLTAGGDGSGNDDIVLEAGTGLTIARSGDKITFTNTVSDTDTDKLKDLSDTPTGYDDGKYLKSTASGTEWATVTSGVDKLKDLSDTPTGYDDGKYLKSTASGTEWANVTSGSSYTFSAQDHGSDIKKKIIRLTDGTTNQDVTIKADSYLSISRAGNEIELDCVMGLGGLSDVDYQGGSPANNKILKFNTSVNGGKWVLADDESGSAADGNTTYSLEALVSPGVKLTGSDNSNDSVFFDAGTGITLTRTNAPGASGGGTIKFEATTFGGTAAGLVPASTSGETTKFLKSDGSWDTAGGSITVFDETTELSTGATTLKFAGGMVAATGTGATKTITIAQPTLTIADGSTASQKKLKLGRGTDAEDEIILQQGSYIQLNRSGQTLEIKSVQALSGLSDVDYQGGSPSNNKILKYSTSVGGGKWILADDNTGGSADGNNYLSGGSWSSSTGTLTLTRSGLSNVTIGVTSLRAYFDNRYTQGGISISGSPTTDSVIRWDGSNWQWSRTLEVKGGTSSNSTNLVVNAGSNSYSGVEVKSNGELLCKRTSTSLEGGHLQFQNASGGTSFAVDVYRNTSGSSSVLRFIDQSTGTERFSVGPQGQWGIGHISRDYGDMGQVMISRGPTLSPVWGNHSGIAGAEAFATNAQGATADVANAEIDHIYSQLNAIGNDDSITTVAQLKTALLALVRN